MNATTTVNLDNFLHTHATEINRIIAGTGDILDDLERFNAILAAYNMGSITPPATRWHLKLRCTNTDSGHVLEVTTWN